MPFLGNNYDWTPLQSAGSPTVQHSKQKELEVFVQQKGLNLFRIMARYFTQLECSKGWLQAPQEERKERELPYMSESIGNMSSPALV